MRYSNQDFNKKRFEQIDNQWQKNRQPRYFLFPNNSSVYLTPGEARFVLHWHGLPPGIPIKSLGNYLNLKTSTVYSYCKTIREKLGITAADNIVAALLRTQFLDYFA